MLVLPQLVGPWSKTGKHREDVTRTTFLKFSSTDAVKMYLHRTEDRDELWFLSLPAMVGVQ
jgi:hypothetical protein